MARADQSLVRLIRGPVTVITLGALFALNNFTPYKFDQTWPVLLIVFGALSIMRRSTEPPVAPAWPPPAENVPSWIGPPPVTGYRQTTYSNPPQPPRGGGSEQPPGAGEPHPRSNEQAPPGGTQ